VAAFGAEAVAGYPAFPPLPPLSGVIDGGLFTRAVTRVCAAASRDDTLPALTCVLVSSPEDGVLELAATDRYRLAIEAQPFTGTAQDGLLVPAVILAKYAKAADVSGKVSLFLGDAGDGRDRAGFSDGTRTLITAVNSGEFPRYRQFAGKPASEYPTVITVCGKTLAAAVTRAGDVTGRNEAVLFAASGTGITVTGQRDGKVTSTQQVAATVTGPAAETGFNAVYLASAVAGIPGDARIEVPAPSVAASISQVATSTPPEVPVIRTPSRVTSGDGFTAIVVPLRPAD
jgi:DNA polymerase-3 subunit beta